jgi:WD40 repeat protein
MLRLVGEDEGDAPVRRRAPLGELDLERNEDVADVLATLADSRLVTVSEGNVEVAHEALLREWPRLRAWIEEDTEGRRLRRHITQAASEWDAAGRDRGELYRGARLAAALDWTADHALDVNELEREFVTESREASEREARRARRTNRRLRVLLAGVAVLLAAAVAGGMLAVDQRGEARDAETAQLAQRLGAQALVEDDLDRSLLLARQAFALDRSPQTRSYLLQALLRSPKADGIMHGRTEFLRAIEVSRDGRTLAVGSYGDGLLFFDTRTYARIGGKSPVTGHVESLVYGPGGDTLAVGGEGFIRLLDARTYEQLAETRVKGLVTRLIFSRDGSRLVVATGENGPSSISIRDPATLAPIGAPIEPEGYAGGYRASLWGAPGLALTPDGSSVLTASNERELVWWDLRSRSATRRVRIGTGHHALAVSSDGDTVAVGVDRGIQLVDTRSGAVRSSAGVLTDAPNWLAFSSDGRTVVSTGLDGAVTLWDVRSATVRETLRGHSASASQPEFSPDGKTLYTTSHDGTAIAWRIAGDRGLKRPFEFTPGRAARDFRHPGAYVLDGRLIAVGLKGRGIGLRDGETLARAGAPLLTTGGEVNALATSLDGRTLAAGTRNGKVTLWDVASRSLRRGPFDVASGRVEGMSFNADETMLATAGPNGVRLWDVATGAARGRVGDGSAVGAVAFSPAAPLVAIVFAGYPKRSEQAGVVEVWNVTRRSLVMRLRPDSAGIDVLGYALAFTADGRVLASGGLGDRFVHLWDVEKGRLLRELEQNVGGVHSLEFSRDGRTLAVGGYGEPYAALVDVATGLQIGPRLTAGRDSATVDVSPDGRSLLQTHGNGEGAVWDIDPESWARRACALANRTLTQEEWKKFLPGRPYKPACGA